ncbi:hypothetical protein MNBD_GAMMA07-2209 [hydrothermal vent metagenome]|uniref:Cytoskeleton protein RodZ-like C-terminal domain-containing protein n=1 Tax=hydrothermal vent metagenome TaxID=652676 RepID=A0A3B0WKV6_9ZZZZ
MSNTTSNSAVSNEVNELLQQKSFGTSLKLARKKSEVTYDQVAENLLLSIEMIKAIENSQVNVLPSAAYTKGYLRNYARLLGLPEDEIINDYLRRVPNTEPKVELVPKTAEIINDDKKLGRDQITKFVSSTAIISVLIVFVFWMFNSDDEQVPELIDVQKDLLIQDSKALTSGVNIESNGAIKNAGLKPAETKTNAALNNMGVVKKTVTVDTATLNDSQVKSSVALAESVNQPSNLLKYQMVLTATGESWCEIKDSTGKRLCFRLLTNGVTKTMTGVPPFNIFLGDARVVSIELNGKLIGHESSIPKYSKFVRINIDKDGEITLAPKRKK